MRGIVAICLVLLATNASAQRSMIGQEIVLPPNTRVTIASEHEVRNAVRVMNMGDTCKTSLNSDRATIVRVTYYSVMAALKQGGTSFLDVCPNATVIFHRQILDDVIRDMDREPGKDLFIKVR